MKLDDTQFDQNDLWRVIADYDGDITAVSGWYNQTAAETQANLLNAQSPYPYWIAKEMPRDYKKWWNLDDSDIAFSIIELKVTFEREDGGVQIERGMFVVFNSVRGVTGDSDYDIGQTEYPPFSERMAMTGKFFVGMELEDIGQSYMVDCSLKEAVTYLQNMGFVYMKEVGHLLETYYNSDSVHISTLWR